MLWRISGKGLKNPSYLFGTMHVKDKRVFGFSDSVMLAIQKSSSFALEVHPDTLIKKMFASLADRDNSRSLRSWLSPAEYAKLAKRFKEKNGYPLGNIDPIRLEAIMKPEKKSPDDKKTFVDAYLYGIAHGMNKSIYGLENAAEQFDGYFGSKSDIKERVQSLVEDNDAEAISREEEMIKIYSTGNLDKIAGFLNSDELNDDDLIARNKVMLESIIKHMDEQSLFSAVGAAHLPGPHGLIELLRNAGYTVSPVKAEFTGVVNKFSTDYTKLTWKPFVDNETGYSFELPFTPEKTDAFYGQPSVLYTDIANEVFFGAYAILKGSESKPATEEEVLQNMINSFKKNQSNHIISKKPVTVNGIKGTEILMRTNGEVLRFRLMFNNNFLYLLYAGTKMENLFTPYANRFFDSFKTFKISPKANPTWITFKNDTGAFTVHLPVEPKLIVKNAANPIQPGGEPFHIKLYMATDSVNLENYLVRYNDYPKGAYLADKNKLFESIGNEFKNKGKIIGKVRKITVDGYEGREVDLILLDKYYCRMQLFVRGNRTYLLMRQSLQEGQPIQGSDDFFESFKLTPYNKPVFTTYNVEGGNFISMVFEKQNFIRDTVESDRSFLKNSLTVYSTNMASGGVYGIEHTNLSKYYRIKHIDSIYISIIPKFVKYTDSLIKVDTIVVNGIQGREFISQKKLSGEKKRNRIFINNGDFFYLTAYLANEELYSETSNAFFNSLKKISDTKAIDLSSSKAALIAEDLASADSTTYKSARGALSYYKFEKEELPYIYKALQKGYPDDSTYHGAGHLLLNTLGKVHDDKTIDVLAELYKRPDINDDLKTKILKTIPGIDKEKGYDVYLNLLTGSPALKAQYNYDTFEPLEDSLDYVVANYKRIIPLINNDRYRKSLLPVFQRMAEEKHARYIDFVTKNFAGITTHAHSDVDRYLKPNDSTSTEMYMSVYYYLSLMQTIKGQPVTAAFTNKLIRKEDMSMLLPTAAITRIANHLPIDQRVINRLLDSIANRYNIMEALSKEKQLERVPLKYKTQAAFAKLCLYQSVSTSDDDDMLPEQLTLLGTVTDKGKLFYVFKYKLNYGDEESTYYRGICGPFITGSAKLDFTSYRAFYEEVKAGLTWQQQAKEMIPGLKKQNGEALANRVGE
ncbi:TraB/GumN family protein [Mucilaginibacter sp.]|uniref:TraB/GumN family protein n=1 Tax=Mucilaginibacter sp. TaxID=1882438 RepID=UPI002ECFC377